LPAHLPPNGTRALWHEACRAPAPRRRHRAPGAHRRHRADRRPPPRPRAARQPEHHAPTTARVHGPARLLLPARTCPEPARPRTDRHGRRSPRAPSACTLMRGQVNVASRFSPLHSVGAGVCAGCV